MEPFQRLPLPPGSDLTFLLAPTFIPKNVRGWNEHQHSLTELIRWAWSNNMEVEIPIFPNGSGWDYGIDVFLNGIAVDVKTFPLSRPSSKRVSREFTSPFWKGREVIRDDSLTEWLVFIPFHAPISQWEAGRFSTLRDSKFANGTPYFLNRDVRRVEVATFETGTRFR
jgi:hypothetical protein